MSHAERGAVMTFKKGEIIQLDLGGNGVTTMKVLVDFDTVTTMAKYVLVRPGTGAWDWQVSFVDWMIDNEYIAYQQRNLRTWVIKVDTVLPGVAD